MFNQQDYIAIVDYGMGNLRSVEKGCIKVGITPFVTSDPKVIENAKAIILPGVGAFRDCMKELHRLKLIDVIVEFLKQGKPFLGICLGLQILFTESEEFGHYKGLDIFGGRVVRFPDKVLKVPHMGWNNIKIIKQNPLFIDIKDGSYFYFVHSYYVLPDDTSIICASTQYEIPFASMIHKENIFAAQFHPEKSQSIGLKMLDNFGQYVKCIK